MSTDSRFPGPGDYAGSFDARMHDAVEGAQSTFDGSIVVTLLERSLVQQVLPDGFHLSARTDGGGEHPVIHLVGHQRDLNGLHNGSPYKLLDNDYSEMILLVPFVLRGSGTKLHTFVVRMYLDDVGATQIGNWIYGYAKEPARLTEKTSPNTVATEVKPLFRSLIFESTVQSTGLWHTSESTSEEITRWADLKTIFEMPLVGVDVVHGNVLRTVCSYWEWDYTTTEVASATSQHQFLHKFRDGMDGWVARGLLSSASGGAFMVRGLRWRLALPPPPCQF
jgi:hypothetical protein